MVLQYGLQSNHQPTTIPIIDIAARDVATIISVCMQIHDSSKFSSFQFGQEVWRFAFSKTGWNLPHAQYACMPQLLQSASLPADTM